ncbi:MAG: regulatory protein RecX [Mariprofundaceae bacterium]|nr:regulatory protein RecX [Mariprofundaceae bacterium]
MFRQDVQEVYSIALRLLTMREHCEVELRNKLLQRDCDEIAIDSVVDLLKQYGSLSEARYAEAFLRYRLGKGEALWFAAEKARQKGVDETALQIAVEEAEGDYNALQSCLGILNKRDPQQQWRYDQRVWQRQARYLRNKGFDAATILQALNQENTDI